MAESTVQDRPEVGGVDLAEEAEQTWDDPSRDPWAPEGSGDPFAATDFPRPPESLEESGLSEDLIAGLVLKALHVRGAALGFDLVDTLALPMNILDGIIQGLQDERLVEVHSTKGPRRGEYVFRLTKGGRARAAEELELSRYVGPAPVPFEHFKVWVERQAVQDASISEEAIRKALEGVVLPEPMFDQLGPAINSGRSLFLYGDPGNGKTLLAERIARAFGREYYVPYSLLVDGSVMILHDPVHHEAVDSGPESDQHEEGDAAEDMRSQIMRSIPEHDRRFARAKRPVVLTGGELTLDQLDLRWDPTGRMYQAPPQLKAAGGVLIVDDLGRQRVPVRDLLNRWVVPLEHRRDYLTLRSGKKIVVPFDCFVIFSTNLEPRSLGDEAFLRRIHYKIEVPNPTRSEYAEILELCCEAKGIEYEEGILDYLFDRFYQDEDMPPRRCHPRDLINHVLDLAGYKGSSPTLQGPLMEAACKSYFLPPEVAHERPSPSPMEPTGDARHDQ